MIPPIEKVDLRELIAHNLSVQSDAPVAQVYEQFATHPHEFVAVREGEAVRGMCSREKLGALLSQPYGRSLFLRQPLRDCLPLSALVVSAAEPITRVLDQAFHRPGEQFFEDILLVDEAGCYLGLIPMQRLVQLQNGFFGEQIELLNRQQAELNEANTAMQQELELAGQLQQSLLPPPPPPPLVRPALDYAFRLHPAGAVSGDFLYVLDAQAGRLGLLLCDVMGHGVRASLISAMIRALVQRDAAKPLSPGEILTRLNRDLAGLLQQDDVVLFVTACCLMAEAGPRRVHFARAGHHLACRRRAGAPAEALAEASAGPQPAIGLVADARYATSTFELQEGDLFLLCTDGLLEAANADGEEFGLPRLLAIIDEQRAAGLPALLDDAIAAARAFAAPRPLDDDVCLAALAFH